MPGLLLRAPAGVCQEGSQLTRGFTFACMLYITDLIFFFLRNKPEAWDVLFVFRRRCFSVLRQAANLVWRHVLFLVCCAHTYARSAQAVKVALKRAELEALSYCG